jgi:hypothetical protein
MSNEIDLKAAKVTSYISNIINVEYLLKARTVGPEKQPLLVNGSERTFVSMQRLQKQKVTT